MTPVKIMRLSHATLTKEGKHLLDDVSVDISMHKSTIIMGHNGAGKTLLLSVLHGLVALDSGTLSHHQPHTQKMVFQKPILMRRSAARHFTFASGISDPSQTNDWFEKARIGDKAHTPARHLSSGEAQKLAVISALAAAPDILFLDEPTSNLDAQSRAEIEALLHDAKQIGTTIVMVTHSLAQAERLADEIIYLQEGQILDHQMADDFLSGKRSVSANHFLAER